MSPVHRSRSYGERVIASVRGEVLASGVGWLVVGVGGFGVRVEIPAGRVSNAHPGDTVVLHTSLVVREDSLTLFGFATPEELEMFGLLLLVSGVGPRSALGVLAQLSPAEVARAVNLEDDAPFRKVSGIGPKTAKLIVVSLAGKPDLARFASSEAPGAGGAREGGAAVNSIEVTVAEALVSLGYAEAQAENAVSDAVAAGAESTESALLRAALALLQSSRSGARVGSFGAAR